MIKDHFRGPEADRARSGALAARLVATLPRRPSIMLVGPDSWPLLLWLAPRIGRAQVWRIISHDAEAIDDVMARIAIWADRHALTVTWPKRAMLVHVPGGAWRIEGVVSVMDRTALRQIDAVVGESLLTVMSPGWLAELPEIYRGPLLTTLNEIGPGCVLPVMPGHTLPRGRDPRAGAAALTRLATTLRQRGDVVRLAVSDVTLRADAMDAQRALLSRMVMHAHFDVPRATASIEAWHAQRHQQMMLRRLRIRLQCRDLLSLPG